MGLKLKQKTTSAAAKILLCVVWTVFPKRGGSICSRVAISTVAAPLEACAALLHEADPSECAHYQCFVNIFMGQKAVSSASGDG